MTASEFIRILTFLIFTALITYWGLELFWD